MKGVCSFIAIAFAVLTTSLPAHALDPDRTLRQYKHTRWTIDDGAPMAISALAQGHDGYLWIASASGLYRFDGLKFERIPPDHPTPPGTAVSTILVARNGDVWIGYSTGGTAVYRGGVLRRMPMPEPTYVMDLVQTPDGSIWATLGRKVRNLFRYTDGRWSDAGTKSGFPAGHNVKLIVARDGTVWISNTDGIFFLPSTAARFERSDIVPAGHAALAEDQHGNIWMSDTRGSRVIRSGRRATPADAIAYASPSPKRKTLTIVDHDGNIWGIADDGVFRVRTPQPGGAVSRAAAQASLDAFHERDGLTSDSARAILEDHEGNIWVGTTVGLDRFRAAAVVVEPMLTKFAFWGDVLLGASDGSVYIGEADAVYRAQPGGKPEVVFRASEPQAMCEGPDGSIWVVLQDRVVRLNHGRTTSIAGPGKADQGISDCAVDRHGGLWLAALRDGIFQRVGAGWKQIMVPPAQGGYPPASLVRRRDGKLIMGFEEDSLAIVDPPQPLQMIVSHRMGLDKIKAVLEVPGGLLIGGGFGLGRVTDQGVRVLPLSKFPAMEDISGIARTRQGEIWMAGAAGLIRMSDAALDRVFRDNNAPIEATVFDYRDGLSGRFSRDAQRSAVAGSDGRVWFSVSSGTVWVDPSHIARNTRTPPVAIALLTANGKTIRDPTNVRLLPGTHSVQISFAVLSLSIPERVKVRYQLSGDEQGWVDPGMRRDAFFTNLGPGHYVFTIIASNNDGVWNRRGATLEFDIPPTFLQSNWFLALCTIGFGLLLWVAYKIRVRQLTGKLRERLEARLAERERIARDLHDTLLQGFQGLILRFQSVANQIPEAMRAHGLLERALKNADKVLSDARNSVSQLRTVDNADIAETLSETAERMRVAYPVEFRMVVEGTPRGLHPLVRDEICRIGEEAIINAFQHGRGSMIEVALSYEPSALTLGVRDDGIGIDPEIFSHGGRQGHFGLVGMRERAQQISADLNVSSRPHKGTEIRLTVPGKIAYAAAARRDWRYWAGLMTSTEEGI